MKLKEILLMVLVLLASCFACFSLLAQPTTTGMLAYFKLNGNTTNSGSTNVTATMVNTSYTTNNAGVANNAVQFGGNTSSVIDFTDNGNLDFAAGTNFTISFSFFFNGTATSGLIDNCLNYNGWGVWLWSTVSGTWNLQFNYRNNSVGSAAATAFTVNDWHHVAAVRNNGTISLYIDGVFRLSASEGSGTPSYPINMIAGGMAWSGFSPPRYNPFGGKIDEIRVYNRALSAAEIALLTPYSLPLKLGNFTAIKKPMSVDLNWETITEQNTSHFEIERSIDGNTFASIGRVHAAGNSYSTKYYSYTDQSPVSGINYYRLKMADLDNTSSYSRVVIVKNDNNTITMQAFPNPVSNTLQLQVSSKQDETVPLIINDMNGKIVMQQQVRIQKGTNTISISVLQLSAGMYNINYNSLSGKRSISFIKN